MKRALSLIMVLALLVSVIPSVFAAEANSELTIAEAAELGMAQETVDKYYVTGEIVEIKSTTWGNMYIADEAGNKLLIYGTYSADGETRYDKLDVKPAVGDTVKVYGVLGSYNGEAQMKNGWIVEHIPGEPPVNTDPTPDTELSLVEAAELGASKDHNSYTSGKYYVTGEIVEFVLDKNGNNTYGNMYIADETGNKFYVYGTYSADGSTRYDKLEVQPVVGDTVKVYGIIGQYNDNPQMKNGWIVEHTLPLGTEANPIILYADIENVITMDGTQYYAAYNVGGMTATITGAESVVYNETTYTPNEAGAIVIEDMIAMRGVPAIFQITGSGEGTVKIAAPVIIGAWDTPAELVLFKTNEINTANIESVMDMGYTIAYTATADGVLKLSMFESSNENWQISYESVIGGVSGASDWYASDGYYGTYEDWIANWGSLEMSAGDTVKINVQVFDAEFAPSTGTVSFKAQFIPTIIGAWDTPAELAISQRPGDGIVNTATVGENDYELYNFTYTAAEDGMLVVGSFAGENGYQAYYNLNGYQSDLIDQTTETKAWEIKVAAGDVVTINVNTYDPESYVLPAGTVTFRASFVGVGTFDYPAELAISQRPGDGIVNTAIVVENDFEHYWFIYTATEAGTLNIGSFAGENGYQAYYNLNGYQGDPIDQTTDTQAWEIKVAAGDVVTLNVNTYDPPSYDLPAGTITFRASFLANGTFDNPAELVIFKGNEINTADIKEEPYVFEYTAETAGVLHLAGFNTEAAGWSVEYAVTNKPSSNVYYSCDSYEEWAAEFADVKLDAGDVIKITVMVCSDAECYNPTSGTLSFKAEFEAETKLGDVNGDGSINAKDATAILKYIVGKLTNIPENIDIKVVGDVNKDGTVNAKDATKILKYIVGKDTIE